MSPPVSPFWSVSAEMFESETRKTVSLATEYIRQLEAVSRLKESLLSMSHDTWGGPSRRKFNTRMVDILGFADDTSALVSSLMSDSNSLVVNSARISDILSTISSLQASQASQDVIDRHLEELGLATNRFCTNLGVLTDRIKRASQVLASRQPGNAVVSSRSAGAGVIDSRALSIVSNPASSHHKVAAALLSSSGSSALSAFRDALSRGVFKPSFAKKVKRLVMASGPNATLLNKSVADWPTSKKRHPIFFDLPVFGKSPSATDVLQGNIGDCWLLASLATVAHHNPEVISSMIKDNFDGSYDVTFADGVTVAVSGDVWLAPGNNSGPDKIADPTFSEFLFAARARQNKGEFSAQWPWILEKAFAARYGSYSNLDGGVPAWALGLLYNKNTVTQQIHEGDKLVQIINSRLDNGPGGSLVPSHLEGPSILDESILSGPSVVGIDGHAYAVLGRETRSGQEYLRLYNPYGSDSIALKDPSVQVIYGKNDGVMLLRLSDIDRAGVFAIDGFL